MNDHSSDSFNRIRVCRKRLGWTQDVLASKLGLRRQAVYDMESGRYMPNTAVALRLAELFGCPVETLFSRPESSLPSTIHVIDGLFPNASLKPGMRLALARIRDELVGIPLEGMSASGTGLIPADGMLRHDGQIDFATPPDLLDANLLMFGCNPALDILDTHIRRRLPSIRTRSFFASSGNALTALAKGAAHVGSIHFHSVDNDANRIAVKRALPDMPCIMVTLSSNEEGFILAQGNPLGIGSPEDLPRPDVRFVNREPGAALRRLLDSQLAARNIHHDTIRGYDVIVRSHAEGAYRILCGAADAALGLRIVADALGLAFLPLAFTRCDLVIPKDILANPAVDALLNALCSARLHRELETLAGYDASCTGREM